MTLPGPVSVLHVLDRLDDADEQRRVRALAQARYRVIDVCALRPATFAPPPAVGFVEGDGTTRGARAALERALQARAYDVVHAHGPTSAMLLLLSHTGRGSSMQGCVVSLPHDLRRYSIRERALLYPLFAAYPAIVLPGRAAYDRLPASLRRLGRGRIWVVPDGVDVARLDLVEDLLVQDRGEAEHTGETEHAPPTTGFTVVSVGRLTEPQDAFTLLRAFDAAVDAPVAPASDSGVPPARLVLVGDLPLRPRLAETAAALGVGSWVTFAGALHHDDASRAVAGADLLVSTATDGDSVVAVLEAMACRTPVVLTDIPAYREVAQDDPGAVPLVPAGDVDGFAREIARFTAMSPLQRRALGERARRLVERRFAVQTMHSALARVYAGDVSRTPDVQGPVVLPRLGGEGR